MECVQDDATGEMERRNLLMCHGTAASGGMGRGGGGGLGRPSSSSGTIVADHDDNDDGGHDDGGHDDDSIEEQSLDEMIPGGVVLCHLLGRRSPTRWHFVQTGHNVSSRDATPMMTQFGYNNCSIRFREKCISKLLVHN